MMSGPVERETHFQGLKRRHGSMFAWHGSGAGNWHVILRTSLKNMSNTELMSAGAAYGNGIYFASDMTVSLGYCHQRQYESTTGYWPKSMFGKQPLTCLAACEIVANLDEFTYHPGKPGARSGGAIFVVPREDFVTTRFLIVNPKIEGGGGGGSRGTCQALVDEAIDKGKLAFLL